MVNKKTDPAIIYFRFLYYGDKGASLIKSCIRTIKRNCLNDRPIVFRLMYDVTKMEFFCNAKDGTPQLCQSNIVYKFLCLGYLAKYVGKTERTFRERTREHA